jgi:hypothetical protein
LLEFLFAAGREVRGEFVVLTTKHKKSP